TRRVSRPETWSHSRRVGIQGAGRDPGVNTRLVVPDMEEARPTGRSQHRDWARGHAENERKAHTRSLQSDRTSCHRFEAKQFRVFLHSAADGCRDPLRREGCKTAPWAKREREAQEGRDASLASDHVPQTRTPCQDDRTTWFWERAAPGRRLFG